MTPLVPGEDGVPDVIAAFEQLGATLRTFGKTLAEYFRSLVQEGFTADQAMQLVVGYQEAFLREMLRGDQGAGE